MQPGTNLPVGGKIRAYSFLSQNKVGLLTPLKSDAEQFQTKSVTNLRLIIRGLLTLGAISILFLVARFLISDPTGKIGGTDLLEYWSAARALLLNQNPYDASVIGAIQRNIHQNSRETILMWNPPLIFPFILPIALIPFKWALIGWFNLTILSFLYSIDRCARIFSWKLPISVSDLRRRPLTLLALLSFPPLIINLSLGQISPLLLIGITFFLFWYSNQQKQLFSGLALSLTLIKPHILFLVYIGVFYSALKTKRFRVVLGFVGGGILLCLIPMAFAPAIYTQYFAAISAPPIYWQTPTLGSWLQFFTSIHSIEIRTAPSLLAIIGYVAFLVLRRPDSLTLTHFIILLPLSVVTSPYSWLFDQLLLLPTLIWMLSIEDLNPNASRLRCGLLLISHVGIILAGPVGQQYHVWYPILIFL
ncbi:MAG: DUF2029 domain-containing protein, partial [Bdellovibrionales bacterium]|nr:DUF2029 domain-containing protein [Bdellovibrionales bacterium]